MAINAYTVLSEFKFEVGGAIAGSDKVTSAVEGISDAAKRAQSDLLGLGMTFVGTFGLGASSIIGVLGKSLSSFDKFRVTQLKFANLISSNMDTLSGDVGTFNDRLLVSNKIIKDIAKDAAKFSLPEAELAQMTGLMTAALVPKGLAGRNFSNARDLSRNLLKSAPSLGIDPGLVQGQLFRSIEGGASMGDTLFRRLSLETKAFQEKLKGSTNAAKAFNALPLKERFKLLQDGMAQFASDTDVLAGNALTLGSMVQRIRDLFGGMNGVLKPIGEAVMPLLIQVFKAFVNLVDNHGRVVIEEFTTIFKMFVSDVKTAAIDLMQVQRLGSDFKGATKAATGTVFLDFFAAIFSWQTLFRVSLTALVIAGGGVLKLFKLLTRALVFLGPIIRIVAVGMAQFAAVTGVFLFIMQTISRAIAIAKLRDLTLLPDVLAGLAKQTRRFMGIMMIYLQPIIDLMDFLANKIAFLFQFSFWLKGVVWLFEQFNTVLILVSGTLRGIVFVILQMLKDIKSGNVLGAFKNIPQSFDEGAQSFFEELARKTKDDSGVTNTSNQNTYMNVNMYNQFKENYQPDRIAVTLQEQLFKAATNPRQAKGRTLQRGTVTQ